MSNVYLNLDPLQDMGDGDKEYECEIIQDILSEGDVVFAEILKCIDDQDVAATGAVIHKFKGCISYVAADSIIEKFQKVEDLGRLNNEIPSKQAVQELKDDYLMIKDLLNQYIKEVS
ncbi:MAG: Hpt domain-containing protein [Candidatus Cloacimonetes bacterium]|nr:Hpt domain-containing protein [Candidatus Cloacimonadota bacterium]